MRDRALHWYEGTTSRFDPESDLYLSPDRRRCCRRHCCDCCDPVIRDSQQRRAAIKEVSRIDFSRSSLVVLPKEVCYLLLKRFGHFRCMLGIKMRNESLSCKTENRIKELSFLRSHNLLHVNLRCKPTFPRQAHRGRICFFFLRAARCRGFSLFRLSTALLAARSSTVRASFRGPSLPKCL